MLRTTQGKGDFRKAEAVISGRVRLELFDDTLVAEIRPRFRDATRVHIPLTMITSVKPIGSDGFVVRSERGTVRFQSPDAPRFKGRLVEASKVADAPKGATRPPPAAKLTSTEERQAASAQSAPVSDFPWLQIAAAGVVLAAVAAQFQIGGITWRWDCEEYAAEQAIEEFADGGALKDGYEFTGVWIIGHCRATFL